MKIKIPLRSEIQEKDKWDLSDLYKNESDYENELKITKENIKKFVSYKNILAQNNEIFFEALNFFYNILKTVEKMYNYVFLNNSVESQNPENQKRLEKFLQFYTFFKSETSWLDSEIIKIDNLENIIENNKFADFKIPLKRLLRQKEHILSEKEEKILALQSQIQDLPSHTFNVLTDIDINFGKINGKPLSQSTFVLFMQNKDRKIREKAYRQFYEKIKEHEQTISSLYIGSIKQNIFNAKVRGFNTALQASLYSDNVSENVYKGLINSIHKFLNVLHKYYSFRKKILKLDELHHYDVYVPIVPAPKKTIKYEQACLIIKDALSVLGQEYTDILYKGLTSDRWVDKYESKGKRSGAFSSGGYIGKPYILLNYNEKTIDSVFALAHEGGHSMHSYFSKSNNPFPYYEYSIFEAEVASTFNEMLLAKYLIETTEEKLTKAYLINKQIDEIVATLFRQTMFAEYELICHSMQENGEALTVDVLRKKYRELLEQYFGPEMIFEDISDLECLRIPHFYSAYYVYKYATGISASITLLEKVLSKDEKALKNYLDFLKCGGSKFPVESLKSAGVDMSNSYPIESSVKKFSSLLNELEQILL